MTNLADSGLLYPRMKRLATIPSHALSVPNNRKQVVAVVAVTKSGCATVAVMDASSKLPLMATNR